MDIRMGLTAAVVVGVFLILPACIFTPKNQYADVPVMDGALHTTQEGETLEAIAKTYNVSVPLIRRVNNVREIGVLTTGTRLFIPGANDVLTVNVSKESSPVEKPDGLYHPVLTGETLSAIAKAYEITLKELQEVNNIYDPNEIRAGDQIWIPRAKEVMDVEIPVVTVVTTDPVPAKTPEPRVRVVVKPTPTPTPAPPPDATPTPKEYEFTGSVNDLEDLRFQWPLKDNFRILQEHDPSKQDYGIDLGAPMGTPVYAVADGTVENVGGLQDILGDPFGNYVIINHGQLKNKSITSIYAHNQKITVAEGDQVKRGQQIAEMGNSGNPHFKEGGVLHFQIRLFVEPLNPKDILPPL